MSKSQRAYQSLVKPYFVVYVLLLFCLFVFWPVRRFSIEVLRYIIRIQALSQVLKTRG